MRHFTEIDDLSPSELERVLDLSSASASPTLLAGKGVALIFEKPSARTRNSMEMAVVQLGGHPVYIGNEEVGLNRRESTEDVTRAMAGFHAAIGARVYSHSVVERMAAVDQVPVINLLSDIGHPMQALADLLTIHQEFGTLKGRSVAYVGDANNVAFSLALGAGLAQMEFRIASPAGYEFDEADLARISNLREPLVCDSPIAAVTGADAVYTDAWTSMGQEAEAETRTRDFEGFQVDEKLMESAASTAIFLHCLPAHRGEEVTDAVLDGPNSRIWPQAANRMHAARGLLVWLLGEANR
ncbi:MAG: ornithine carbamoyltransferase [Acidimicrobiaceae bacterium]|nr:ornithine carbamoyltransferase [Acidimicrobiaceae bacterium]MDE0607311.1 ornithine carbamoyltransferase [Acidimicrobiaceae bacterium]